VKQFIDLAFDLKSCQSELAQFHQLLETNEQIGERAIQELLRQRRQLAGLLGTFTAGIGPADRLGYEFPILDDFTADLVVGRKGHGAYCLIELEDARRNSLFAHEGKKSTRKWGRRFEHGFSQLVDWFHLLDDVKNTDRFARDFGHQHVTWTGMLIVGRSSGLTEHERQRLRWRADRVSINSHKVTCLTYDDVYEGLQRQIGLYTAASGGV
jgi:hypothetical protein